VRATRDPVDGTRGDCRSRTVNAVDGRRGLRRRRGVMRARQLDARQVAEAERPDREPDDPQRGEDRRGLGADPERTRTPRAARGEDGPLDRRDLCGLYEIDRHVCDCSQ
jgi:hypothetical protein